MSNVYITSFSSLSSIGIGTSHALENLAKENQLLHFPDQNDKFSKPYFPIHNSFKDNSNKIECSQFALKLLEEIEKEWITNAPIPVFLGTSTGGIKETEEVYSDLTEKKTDYRLLQRHFFSQIIDDIKEKYKDKIEETFTFSTACSSSGHSILQAYNFIKEGIIKKALVLSVDVLSYTTMIGFDSLKLVSEKGTKPLSMGRDGLSLGEGGGVLLLESDPKNEPLGEIKGGHSNSDGFHISSPDPSGTQQKICMEQAIKKAGIEKKDIDYINAHGTGTPINDEVEMKVIKSIFDPGTIVTSLKSFIGHTLGASAATEIALALGMLKNKKIYQPKNMGTPIDEDYIPTSSKEKNVRYFLKNSFGFGGNNVCLVIENYS